ncbi:MAG: hypothetical protein ACTSRS_19850 [Candidatus Helarchaeota archaeon]
MVEKKFSRDELNQKNILQLISLLTDTKRIQKARSLKYRNISIIYQSSEGYMYEIKGSHQSYFLKIDQKKRVLIHNCEDWIRRGIPEYQLCKHFVRIFQELYEKEAKALLIDLLLHPWTFTNSDAYLKNI